MHSTDLIKRLDHLTDEVARLEKERFKYETALMLISEGILQPISIAKAALTKQKDKKDGD